MTRDLWMMALILAGCPMGGDEVPTGETGVAETATLSGTVARTAPIAADGDGIGTLFVAALDACPGAPLGSAGVPSADLSADGAEIPFVIANLPRTTVHLALFLDDDGNADLAGPLPDPGDLVYGQDAGDGAIDCVEVDLSGGDAEIALELNLLEE